MAEVLLSPGVSLRENDTSQITSGPITAGLALVGPTVKGRVNIPTLVTTYSDFQSKFGDLFESASANYEFLTSIAAYNYFQQGGESILVTRVTSGSYTSATSSIGNQVPATNGAYASCSFTLNTYQDLTVVPSNEVTPNFQTNFIFGNSWYKFIAVNTSGSGTIPQDDADGLVYFYAWNSGSDSRVILNQNLQTKMNTVLGSSGAGLFTVNYNSGNNTIALTASLQGIAYNGAYITLDDPVPYYDANYALIGYVSSGTGLLGTTANGANGNPGYAFTLETISEGVIMNNNQGLQSNGSLISGSADNVRWQVVSPDTASGTFTLLIRQGDDTTTNPNVLESFTNVSLDPNQANYIEAIVGNYSQTVAYDSSTGQYYIQGSGSYANASRYVRVKEVLTPTYNYFNNNGIAKTQYYNSIPTTGSGSFGGAFGNDLDYTTNLYQNISTVTQGLVASDYTIVDDILANPDEYNFQLISAPGITQQYQSTVVSQYITMAEERGDCFYITDLVGYGATINTPGILANQLNTNYAAAYWPWVQVLSAATGKLVWVPASTVMPGVYAFNDRVSAEWFAPAGLNRGGVAGALQAERKLGTNDRDTLYQNKVNPIASFPGVGLVAYGQKTLQTKASALDRINVRRLLINLKRYVRVVAESLLFEQNTLTTRNNFVSQVNPYMESVQQRQGLYAYKVVMDDSNNTPDVIDRNQLVGAIYIQPAKTVEFIYITFNITPTGVTFGA